MILLDPMRQLQLAHQQVSCGGFITSLVNLSRFRIIFETNFKQNKLITRSNPLEYVSVVSTDQPSRPTN